MSADLTVFPKIKLPRMFSDCKGQFPKKKKKYLKTYNAHKSCMVSINRVLMFYI